MLKKLLFLLIIALLGWLGWRLLANKQGNLTVGGKTLRVEIADTPAKREQGLSGRKSLCPDCGMLFVFDKKGTYPFWMKEMYFDLDILWIADNKVVDITYGAKQPSSEDFDKPRTIYSSASQIDKVLEVNAEWTKENGVGIGDEVKLD